MEQEIWGHLLVHYAIRSLMHTAAAPEYLDTDRLSFTRTQRLVRRQVSAQAGSSPDRLAHALAEGAVEILARLLPFRRRRSNPRVVKRKMSKFALKRSGHQGWLQPTHDPVDAIQIAPHYRTVAANKALRRA